MPRPGLVIPESTVSASTLPLCYYQAHCYYWYSSKGMTKAQLHSSAKPWEKESVKVEGLNVYLLLIQRFVSTIFLRRRLFSPADLRLFIGCYWTSNLLLTELSRRPLWHTSLRLYDGGNKLISSRQRRELLMRLQCVCIFAICTIPCWSSSISPFRENDIFSAKCNKAAFSYSELALDKKILYKQNG